MKRVEEFVDYIVKGVPLNLVEQDEMREEMLGHLMEHIDDLMLNGYSKDEAIEKALLSFGDSQVIQREMKKVLFPYYKFVRFGICTFFVTVLLCFVSHFVTQYYFPQNDPAITVDVFILFFMICLFVLGVLEAVIEMLEQSKRKWLNEWGLLFFPALALQIIMLWRTLSNPDTTDFWIYNDYLYFPLYVIFYIVIRHLFTVVFIRKSVREKDTLRSMK